MFLSAQGPSFTAESGRIQRKSRVSLSALCTVAVHTARVDKCLLVLAFIGPLLAYLRTLSPTAYNLDSAELTTAAYRLGLMRATGYPLYILVGKLFSLLPVGDVGYRLNLMSAVFGALTVALVYRIALVLVGRPISFSLPRSGQAFGFEGLSPKALALSAALCLGFSYYFWSQAVVAEVYTLHTALMAALILLLLRWRERSRPRLLAAIAGLYGLSFANHMATILLGPGLVAFVLMIAGRGTLRPRRLVPLALAFALGLSVYLYLPLRYLAAPAFNYVGHFDATGRFIPTDLTRPAGLWALMTGAPFQGLMFAYPLSELPGEIALFIYRLWGNFLSAGLPIGLLGALTLWRRDRPLGLMLVLLFLANVAFYVDYRVVDKETMFLPAYLVWALWVAVGFRVLYGWAAGASQRRQAALAALFGLTALAGLVINGPQVDVSQDRRAHALAESLLTRVEPNAIILGWWASVPPMQYLQLVEGYRPDVLLINRWLISGDDLAGLIAGQLDSRPIYLVENDRLPTTEVELISIGGAYRVRRAPAASAEARSRGQDRTTCFNPSWHYPGVCRVEEITQ